MVRAGFSDLRRDHQRPRFLHAPWSRFRVSSELDLRLQESDSLSLGSGSSDEEMGLRHTGRTETDGTMPPDPSQGRFIVYTTTQPER